jgi:hypothetical protein
MDGWEVRLRDRRRDRRRLLAWLILVLCLPAVFWLGGVWRGAPLSSEPGVEVAPAHLEELEQRLTVLSSAEQVARQADEHSRQRIKLLEEQIFKLQQDLAFYKGVLAPGSRRDGLRIRSFDIQPTDASGTFRYNIMLSRVGQEDSSIKGSLQVFVDGAQAGKAVRLDLAKLSSEHTQKTIPFEFKHFQAIPATGRFAELKLPVGFVAESIVVRAMVAGQESLERTFKWIDVE